MNPILCMMMLLRATISGTDRGASERRAFGPKPPVSAPPTSQAALD